jgi:hypothetical protein
LLRPNDEAKPLNVGDKKQFGEEPLRSVIQSKDVDVQFTSYVRRKEIFYEVVSFKDERQSFSIPGLFATLKPFLSSKSANVHVKFQPESSRDWYDFAPSGKLAAMTVTVLADRLELVEKQYQLSIKSGSTVVAKGTVSAYVPKAPQKSPGLKNLNQSK